MDVKKSEEQVTTWAKLNSDILGLIEEQVRVNYIWNPGGFVNQSFRVFDHKTSFHLKLANESHSNNLHNWLKVNDFLSIEYNSPKIVKEVDEEILPGYYFGLMFEYVQGGPLNNLNNPSAILDNVLGVINQLHHDNRIKHKIHMKKEITNADAFLNVYIDRFNEDLNIIESNKELLPFVDDHTFDWLRKEVHELESTVKNSPLFHDQANDVVHNDLNWQNILVDSVGNFRIIDWDDLSVAGDAAMDYSALLWPIYDTKDWPWFETKVQRLAGDGVLQRIEYYFRAKLLDEVIDVLADYIEAEDYPQVREKTQKRAKEIHLKAYSAYRAKYKEIF